MATGHRSMRSRAAATAAVVLVSAGLLAACSDEPEPEPTTSATPTVPESVTEPFADLDEGWQGVLRDVTVAACPTAAGDVVAKGTVLNSAAEPRDITILASWLAPGTSDPLLQLEQTLEDVPAGETRDWSVSGLLPAEAGQCIVGARSGTLSG